jgi:zearalenone synthase (highly reducing iterative type I polyketide synthase)
MTIEHDFEAARVKQQFHEIDKSCTTIHDVGAFYKSLAAVGMNYGETFRNLVSIRGGNSISSCTLRIGDDGSTFVAPNSERPHVIHPTTLDALLHCIFAATIGNNSIARGGMVPTLFEEMVIAADIPFTPGEILKAYATARKHGFREVVSDIEALDEGLMRQLVTLRGVHLTAIQDLSSEPDNDGRNDKKICSSMAWQPSFSLMTPAELQEWINAIEEPRDQITTVSRAPTSQLPD